MEQEDRERLKQVLALAERNNRILKKLYGAMRWGRVLKIIYWIVIVGVAVGAFYFLQPVFQSVSDTYRGLDQQVEGIREIFNGVTGEAE